MSAYFLYLFVQLASSKRIWTEDLEMKLNDNSWMTVMIKMNTVISADRKIVRKKTKNMSVVWKTWKTCVVLRVSFETWLLFQIITDFKGRPKGAYSPSHESLLFKFCLQKDKHLLVFLLPFLMLTKGKSRYLCNFCGFL